MSDLIVAAVLLAATVTVLLPGAIRRRRPHGVEPVSRRTLDHLDDLERPDR